ncbi:MAG: fibronectin type III domain-containing protein, partial [Bacteroidales bacterium]|nr:fibronectin type III domain-containing protein [Bacteroidales bacterium]
MKKHLLSVLLALLLAISGWAQNELIVGEDYTTTYQSTPVPGYFGWHWYAVLYTEDELSSMPSGSTITSIAYNVASLTSGEVSFKVWMYSADEIDASSSWQNIKANATLVYDGSINPTANEWIEIQLDDPFTYTGGGVVILTEGVSCGTSGSCAKSVYSTTETTQAYGYCTDYTAPSETVVLSSDFTTHYKPATKFIFTSDGADFCAGIKGSLTLSNITSDGAEISWTATDEGSYQLQYKKSTESWDDITDIENLSDNTYTFVGLDAMTKYDVKVRNNCSTMQSSWRNISFTTACAGLTLEDLPKTWGFESSEGLGGGTTSYPLPECWQRVSGNYPYTYSSSYYANTGSYSLYWGYSNNGIAILPYINTEELDITTLQLSFYAESYYNYNNSIEVGIMTDPSSESSFTTIESITLSNTYQLYEVPFNSYEGDGAYIAIRFNGSGTSNYAMIDDVTLDVIPDCPKPNDLTVTAAPTSAKVTWSQGGEEATSWVVYYKQ